MPAAAPASSAATCEPSSCTSNQPFWKAGSAWTLGWRPAPSIGGMRMPCGASRSAAAPMPASSARMRSRSAFSVLTRRSSGGRVDKRRALVDPVVAEGRPRAAARTSPGSRRACGRRIGKPAAIASRAVPRRSSGGGANLSPCERLVQRLRRLVPFEQQRAEADGARRVGAEQPAGRALAAQRVVDDVADRRSGRRRRRSGATGPSPSAHRPPAGGAGQCPPALRWPPPVVRPVAFLVSPISVARMAPS